MLCPLKGSQTFPGSDIPQADVIVLASTRNYTAIGTESNAYNISPMSRREFSGGPRYQHPTSGPCRHRLPLASVRPSGLNATMSTSSVCPKRNCSRSPVSLFHRRMVLSQLRPTSTRPVRTERNVQDNICESSDNFDVFTRIKVPQTERGSPTPHLRRVCVHPG